MLAPRLLNRYCVGGIVGKLSFEQDQLLAHPVLEQMLDAVWPRGANSRGIRTASGVALGWRGEGRSAVVRSILAVADVALANASELRAALTRAGRPVRDASDAELLAHAYDEWGDRCIERLQGAFAVAIWDGRRRRLLLAGDRAGARPLYYALLHGHGVVFASSIRALLQDPGVSREWSPSAIDAYLAYGSVPAPLTPYERISKLEPAQRLIVEGRRFHLDHYWTPSATGNDIQSALCYSIHEAINEAVNEQPADAGILYSGGPGSAALVACAPARHIVTIGLDQDTRDLARGHALAQQLGAEPVLEIPTSIPTPGGAITDIAGLAAEVAACLDEPSANPALVGQLAMFRAASRHFDRALTGHGAQALWSDRAPAPTPWPFDHRFALYTRRFARDVTDKAVTQTGLARPMPFDDLPIAGRLAQHAGIELLFPHADPRLIALAADRADAANPLRTLTSRPAGGVAAGSIAGGGVAAGPLPRLQRRRPQHPWVRAAVNAMAPTLLLGGRFDARGMVIPSALRNLWDGHRLGRQDHTRRLWSLLMLELWLREYIDGGGVELPLEYAYARAA